MIYRNILLLIMFTATLASCNNGPKVITAQVENDTNESVSGIFSETNNENVIPNTQTGSFTEDLHKVTVNEILPATKYVYLKVTEAGEEFWIAARKQDIELGGTYYYRNGLLKTNFESKEYNRMFERIFLVSNLVHEVHGNNTGTLKPEFGSDEIETEQKQSIPTHTEEIVQHKGSIKIADLVANPANYEGKTVQLTGKCVKINPNIMSRNWIHLQDGSKNDFDLVITSNTFVPEGKTITIKAKVVLNKDFGAGYRYDLILEDGIILE